MSFAGANDISVVGDAARFGQPPVDTFRWQITSIIAPCASFCAVAIGSCRDVDIKEARLLPGPHGAPSGKTVTQQVQELQRRALELK